MRLVKETDVATGIRPLEIHFHGADARSAVVSGQPLVAENIVRAVAVLGEESDSQGVVGIEIEYENAARLEMTGDAVKGRLQINGVENVVQRIIEARRGVEGFI